MSLIARIASLSNRDRITSVGMALTGAWLFLVLLFWLLAPGGGDGASGVARLVSLVGVILPVALVWTGVNLARQLAELRAESDDLRARLSRLRGEAMPGEALPGDAAPQDAEPEPRPQPAAMAQPRAARVPAQPRPRADDRPNDRPGVTPEEPGQPIAPVTLIQALNFPDGPDDHAAIEALRAALADPANSRVLRAAQDVVTLMAGRDIYMDDLPPHPARPDVWRRFAAGERGSAVAALGGIHQPEALQIAAAMMQEDEIFRDTAQHFLRHFDGLTARLVPHLDDLQIAVLADSRSARAFMLLGRVSGVFG